MSIKLMAQVWETAIDRPQKFVLLALADHADDEGNSVYPSMERIGWKTGYSKRHIQRIMDELVSAEILEVVALQKDHRPTEYKIHIAKAPMSPPFSERGDILSERGDTAMSSEPSKNLNTSSKEDAKPKKKGRDPRLSHPAIKAYRTAARLYVPIIWRNDVIETVGSDAKNVRLWNQIMKDWIGKGWRKDNIKGMLECYKRGGVGYFKKPPAPRAQQIPAAEIAASLENDT